MTERQTWYTPGALEVRQAAGAPPRLVGYAAVFNRESVDLGGFVEVIRPGAFTRTLTDGHDIRAFYGHDPNLILGRQANRMLHLTEDGTGLRAEIALPETPTGREVLENVRNGNLDGMSFAFRLYDPETGQRWETRTSPARREILEAEVFEVSVVAMPAYPDTSVAVRAFQARTGGARLAALERRLAAQSAAWRKTP